MSTSSPNIIYLLSDDLGYGDVGCFGQKQIQTPNIDRMATEGVRFTDHYAGSSVCAPSRCVLMTGLHTGHCYVRNNRALEIEGNVPLPAETQTVGKLLKGAGYATACIGKWGLGYPGSEGDPNNQGFDHFFGYNCQREAHTYYPQHLWRNDQKIMLYGKSYSHDLLTAEALQFVRDQQSNPFYLYLAYTIPHTRFEVPSLGIYEDKPWTENQKTQAAMITRMDRDIGTLLDLLNELGLAENTLVIFTSDNGPHGSGNTLEHFNAAGPLREKKGSLYEGGIRVPFVARWPGKIQPGTNSDHPSAFYDMLPTFCELADASVPEPVDGISMLPALLGRDTQKTHEFLYWERLGVSAVRMGNWKAYVPEGHTNPDGVIELYDLNTDIGEQSDVAADHPDILARIRTIVQESHCDTPWETWEYNGPMPYEYGTVVP
ncbi:MAG: arylsulfatase [Candidatus Latescibacteria bacterium]|nr:arylsulfatase [Candidatus Latescibacterota bacterium]